MRWKRLRDNFPAMIDPLLLDGADALYPKILKLTESRLKPGAWVVADDADHSPECLPHVQWRSQWLPVDAFRRRRRAVHAGRVTAQNPCGEMASLQLRDAVGRMAPGRCPPT
jgi:predicted O-methyltransferase YrrM